MRDYEPVNEMSESTTARVDPSNVEQLSAWDGAVCTYWAARADLLRRGGAGYHGQFLAGRGAAAGVGGEVVGLTLGVTFSSHLGEVAPHLPVPRGGNPCPTPGPSRNNPAGVRNR